MNNAVDNSISTTLSSIESKIDSMLSKMEARPTNNAELEKRIGDADSRFHCAFATLNMIQSHFMGVSDVPSDETIYFSVETAKNELVAAYKILSDGTFYDGNLQ